MKETLQDLLQKRILILDGAMGTMIQQYGLTEVDYRGDRFMALPGQQKGNNELLTLSRPDVISDIHRKYLEAGADIIETNTFSAQRISLADYHCEDLCEELNRAAVRLARELADEYTRRTPEKPRFVAASIGPTNKTCSMSPDVNDPALRTLTFDELAAAYAEQMKVLIVGGADALLIETIFDTLNAKAALYAAREAMEECGREVPLMLSATVADKSGRMLSGQTLTAFLASIMDYPILSVGLNCSFGAADMKPFLKELAAQAPFYISAYPNAGLPNSMGGYDQTPEEMAKAVAEFIEEGLVNIIGGCCGTTDAFIAQYPRLVQSGGQWRSPHQPASRPTDLWLSGLERLEVNPQRNFVNIGERCNVAGSRKFLRLVKEKQYEEALHIARRQVESGAQVLDINMDDGLLDSAAEMTHFLNLLSSDPDIARVPVMIDSSSWDVVLAGLKCLQGKCIVNSISLKEGEEVFLRHARDVQQFGAAVVVMAFDETGQADTYERKIAICRRAYDLLVSRLQFNPNDIIFDPNVLAICTGMEAHDNYALDFIRATGWIRRNLPGAHVSGGISNLSFSFRGNNYLREAMHAAFLYHAIREGLDMGIVNPASAVMYNDIPTALLNDIEDALFNRQPGASERLIAHAQQLKEQGQDTAAASVRQDESWRQDTVDNRLATALMKGVTDYLETDLEEALRQYPQAVQIIEGPLMDGMNRVGELFGAGKMFLPQVVKTARTMKRAVEILQPHIERDKIQGAYAGRIVLATVKGDVHDIGKNIVSVVLACNNYEVIDLGVMCPAEKIVEAARSEKADFVGLSGLITPSLEEMVNVAQAMNEAGLSIPILVGGATTSRLHTALKIAPHYNGLVVWTKDASQIVPVLARLAHPETRAAYAAEVRKTYADMVADYERRQTRTKELTDLQAARNRKPDWFGQ